MVSVEEEVSSSTEARLCICQGRLVWVGKLDGRDNGGGHRNDVGIRVPIYQLHGGVHGFQGIDNRLRAFLQLKVGQILQIISSDVTPGKRSNDLEERSDYAYTHARTLELTRPLTINACCPGRSPISRATRLEERI